MAESPILHIKPNASIDEGALAIFDASSMGLVALDGAVNRELWCGPSDQFSFIDIQLDDPIDQDPAPVVEQAYLALFSQAKKQGFSSALRIWQFIPGINEGSGDHERYRRFCVGRAKALEVLQLPEDQMCAATAIGCYDETFRLVGLFGRIPGESIENPRQVSAWQYPREYGPVSPAFARATTVSLNGRDSKGGLGLMVSGTAAVVGHVSAHPNDVSLQTQETITNVEAVLSEVMSAGNHPQHQLGANSYARAYVRHEKDADAVLEMIQSRWPHVQVMMLLGDICRSDLMVEIELWRPL